MEQLVRVARTLREEHDFRGYIHLKTIPEASPDLIAQAGRYADRLSVNIELPTRGGPAAPRAARRTPGRDPGRRHGATPRSAHRRRRGRSGQGPPRFAPAGQSTQMIVGADGADDATILARSADALRRLSAEARLLLRLQPDPGRERRACRCAAPPLLREHRLYQADWLMRFYGFAREEIVAGGGRRHARPRRSTRSSPGRCAPRALPGRPQPRRPRDAAARAGPRRAHGRPHPAGAPPAAPAPRRPRAASACRCGARAALLVTARPAGRAASTRPALRPRSSPAPRQLELLAHALSDPRSPTPVDFDGWRDAARRLAAAGIAARGRRLARRRGRPARPVRRRRA